MLLALALLTAPSRKTVRPTATPGRRHDRRVRDTAAHPRPVAIGLRRALGATVRGCPEGTRTYKATSEISATCDRPDGRMRGRWNATGRRTCPGSSRSTRTACPARLALTPEPRATIASADWVRRIRLRRGPWRPGLPADPRLDPPPPGRTSRSSPASRWELPGVPFCGRGGRPRRHGLRGLPRTRYVDDRRGDHRINDPPDRSTANGFAHHPPRRVDDRRVPGLTVRSSSRPWTSGARGSPRSGPTARPPLAGPTRRPSAAASRSTATAASTSPTGARPKDHVDRDTHHLHRAAQGQGRRLRLADDACGWASDTLVADDGSMTDKSGNSRAIRYGRSGKISVDELAGHGRGACPLAATAARPGLGGQGRRRGGGDGRATRFADGGRLARGSPVDLPYSPAITSSSQQARWPADVGARGVHMAGYRRARPAHGAHARRSLPTSQKAVGETSDDVEWVRIASDGAGLDAPVAPVERGRRCSDCCVQ